MATLTFYSQGFDPMSQSISLVLAANDIPHKTVSITEGVASLHNNGKSVADSYLAAVKILENESKLKSDSTKMEKQMKLLQYFKDTVQPLFLRTVLTGNPREGLDLFFEALAYLENELVVSGGPYFGGKSPGVLDYGMYPWLEKVGRWIPGITHNECTRLQAWVERMRDEPVVSKVMPLSDVSSLETYKHSQTSKMPRSA